MQQVECSAVLWSTRVAVVAGLNPEKIQKQCRYKTKALSLDNLFFSLSSVPM